MSLVFAAITPHPPLLVPAIGKEKTAKLQATADAFDELEKKLYIAKPDAIIVFSPHGLLLEDTMSMNVNPEFTVNLKEFGDLVTTQTFKGAIDIAFRLREAVLNAGYLLNTHTSGELDYGTGIPLLFLMRHLPDVPVLPIGNSLLPAKTHFDFGYQIKEAVMNTNKRVALIASSDLSHRLTSDAPGGFSPAGKQFDDAVLFALQGRNTTALLNLDPAVVHEAASCGWYTLIMLLGALQRVNYELSVLAYESPFGVGYLTAEFALL